MVDQKFTIPTILQSNMTKVLVKHQLTISFGRNLSISYLECNNCSDFQSIASFCYRSSFGPQLQLADVGIISARQRCTICHIVEFSYRPNILSRYRENIVLMRYQLPISVTYRGNTLWVPDIVPISLYRWPIGNATWDVGPTSAADIGRW